jgi:hypothetical protein
LKHNQIRACNSTRAESDNSPAQGRQASPLHFVAFRDSRNFDTPSTTRETRKKEKRICGDFSCLFEYFFLGPLFLSASFDVLRLPERALSVHLSRAGPRFSRVIPAAVRSTQTDTSSIEGRQLDVNRWSRAPIHPTERRQVFRSSGQLPGIGTS